VGLALCGTVSHVCGGGGGGVPLGAVLVMSWCGEMSLEGTLIVIWWRAQKKENENHQSLEHLLPGQLARPGAQLAQKIVFERGRGPPRNAHTQPLELREATAHAAAERGCVAQRSGPPRALREAGGR